MLTLLLMWLVNAVSLLVVAQLLPGFVFASLYSAFVTALVLGLVNAIIRPLILLLTLPITIITLGLFALVVNAAMLLFVASIVKGFEVDGFGTALVAAILLFVISLLSNLFAESLTNRKSHLG